MSKKAGTEVVFPDGTVEWTRDKAWIRQIVSGENPVAIHVTSNRVAFVGYQDREWQPHMSYNVATMQLRKRRAGRRPAA